MRHWRVAATTALIAGGLALVKGAIELAGADFIEISPLYTSVVAGGIFVIGLLVAGTLADYKEAERMPAEVAAALENIHEDAVSIKATYPALDLERIHSILAEISRTFRGDLAHPSSRACLDAVRSLSAPLVEMERLDVPANYIVRLRAEQGTIRRFALRAYHIQRTAFLPSAYVLIQTIVALIIGSMLFTRLDPIAGAVVVIGFISYFFIYLVRLLHILDTPFKASGESVDDVSLFLLKEFERRVGEDHVAEG